MSEVANVLSFDVEYWYTATLLREEVTDPPTMIEESVRKLLAALRKHEVHATLFTVGEVASSYPDLIRDAAAEGHEIASHGHTHLTLSELTPTEFEEELTRSIDAIRTATGERPSGFRAPTFSITPQTGWAIDVLKRTGFEYDSSVFPVRTPMYGTSAIPVRPHVIGDDEPFADSRHEGRLMELPPAVFHPRVRIPIAGGFYGRTLPVSVLKQGIRNLNRRGIPAVIYFHPWEFNPPHDVSGITPHKRLISFYGCGRLGAKLDSLLSSFRFRPARDVVADYV